MPDVISSSLAVIILSSGMFAVLLPLMLMVWYRDKTVKLPIDREQLLRLPGYGLQDDIRNAQLDLFGGMVLAIVVVAMPFAVYSAYAFVKSGDFPLIVLLFTLAGIPYFAYKTVKLTRKLTRLRLGYVAEVATAAELMLLQAKGYQVFHDIQADKFNIDHLVVGPNGVFAIETKGRHKRLEDTKVTSLENGVVQKGHELIYKNGLLGFPSWNESEPLEQAERQAKWVSQWLSKAAGIEITAVPVLVFPGWYIRLQSRPPFPLLNHKQILGTLPKVGNCQLTQEQINAIAWQVAQRAVEGPRE
ncbi:NERD domain-containing protein [Shewanella sp. JM162201]|uniref:NERD domain-containing protein n=1 Tax=Shewanella jiangmenensis TaxID=2837387 RepID=A0ABS5V5A7_9GAMM|nr:nuclease-related domain-containing protein [Shewanella jiangmenensis]MBT1444859.1 NERD domain-containing protein [Shewanella jiangmenensis]